jgi:hypothetical protein
MRKVYISTFINQAGETSGHIVTKTTWDRLFWTERTVIKHRDHEVHLSRPDFLDGKMARRAAVRILEAWIKDGCPSNREMVDRVRKRQVWA